MNELIIPRRKFLIGTATLMANIFAGPAIVRASSLMDINSMQNRIVVAFKDVWSTERDTAPWLLSLLNMGDYTPELIDKWKRYGGGYNDYALMRRADVLISTSPLYQTAEGRKREYQRMMDSIAKDEPFIFCKEDDDD